MAMGAGDEAWLLGGALGISASTPLWLLAALVSPAAFSLFSLVLL